MNYSRRQLEALGEPFGESATRLKLGGRVYGSGGGGGGSAPAPDKTTQTMELPEWARPYAQSTLAKGEALTDINQNPYQQYGGNRIAGFSPMQMRSFQGAANMDAGPRGFQENVGGYMSPYMQNVVDVEKRGAIRDYQVGNTMQQAQATQAGAFGGGREAIQRAERERGLMGTLGGIQARGAQSAFDQASNQFRQGIQQGVAVNQLQNQYGGQMQQQAQRPLDMAYQDFQNQKNYPYQQLGFMSDLVRGMPLGQQSTRSMYQAPPSGLQTLGALGLGAYGAKQLGMFAEGGLMSSYAEGGDVKSYAGNEGSVTSQDNKDKLVNDTYSIEALMQAKEAALARRDVDTANAIDERIAQLNAIQAQSASIDRGLGSAFNQIPEDRQETMMAANGGIVAFAGEDESLVTDDKMREVYAELNDDDEGGSGNAEDNAFYKNEGRRLYGELVNEKASAPMTDKQRRAETRKNYGEVESMAGPAPYKAQADRIAGLETQQIADLGQQKGLAAIAAIPTMLQGNNAVRGLGGAGGAFAGMYGKALQADRAEKRALMSMKNNLEDAQYKMKIGMVGDARQLTAESRRDRQAAEAARIAKLKALGILAATQERANRPPKAATRNFDIENRDYRAEVLKATTPMEKGETPEQYDKRLKSIAAMEIYVAKNTKDITSKSDVTSTVSSTSNIAGNKADVEQQKADTGALSAEAASLDKARAALNKLKNSRDARNQKKWKDMVEQAGGSEEAAGEAYVKGYMVKPTDAAPAAKPAAAKPAAAPAKAAAAPKQVLPDGSTTGKFVQGKGYEVFKDGKLIGYAQK